jgi:UDP-N-acetylmuramate dehydrogenase
MNTLIQKNISLKRFNTLRLDSTCDYAITPLNIDGVVEAIKITEGKRRVILGNGSNVLLTKEHYDDSTAFILMHRLDDLDIVDNEIIVEAGRTLHDLAWFTMDHEVDGYAFCEDIPGTVGGALLMNAGQWEYTISQYVNWVEVVHCDDARIERIYPQEGFFGYRHSAFNTMNAIIVRSGLSIIKGGYNDIFEKIMYYKRERYMKQPRNYPNAGSVFKRPYKNGESLYVWKLFDATNLRGHQVGGAQISDKHPGFIVNVDNATSTDCVQLIEEAKRRVKAEFDVDLELEWRII